jgi:hypothetical protein
MSINELKRELKRVWKEDPAAELCLRLVDHMQKLPNQELRMITFGTINRVLNLAEIDEHVLRALAILAGSRLHVLDTHFLLIDEADEEFEVAKAAVEKAKEDGGVLIHPVTGHPVKDFEERLFPYFAASEQFMRLKASNA